MLPNTPMGDPFSTLTAAGTPTSNYYAYVKWPLAFGQQLPSAYTFNPGPAGTQGDNSPWDNGKLIANYLAGTNAAYAVAGVAPAARNVTWPRFPGSTASVLNYLGKYTPRQIDSIAIQILNLSGNDVSVDWGSLAGTYTRSADLAFRGWLSGQLVNGVGRNPKLDKVLMEFTVKPGTQPPSAGTYGTAPSLAAALYMELWLPSGFQGVSLFHNSIVYGSLRIGTYLQPGLMNCQDMGQFTSPTAPITGTNPLGMGTNNFLATLAPLPKLPAPTNNGVSPPNGMASSSGSYWGNNLLRTMWGTNTPSGTNVYGWGGIDWGGQQSRLSGPGSVAGRDPSVSLADEWLLSWQVPRVWTGRQPGRHQ